MNNNIKILLALEQLENVMTLLEGNQWEMFVSHHLIPVQYELRRQLTNLSHSTKIKESKTN
jgi:hypothetical protein